MVLLLLLLSLSIVVSFKYKNNIQRIKLLKFKKGIDNVSDNDNVKKDISSNNSENVERERLSLSLSQIKPFLDIATPFFQEDKVARDSLGGVIALTLINSGISVGFSYVSRDFYNALNERNEVCYFINMIQSHS